MTASERPFIWVFYECVEAFWWPEDRWGYLEEILASSVFNTTVLDYMSCNKYGIVLAVTPNDCMSRIAKVVRKLNKANVPVKFWIVLDDTAGYWANALNIRETLTEAKSVAQRAKNKGLVIDGIGIDLEYPVEVARYYDQPLRFVPKLLAFLLKAAFKAKTAQKELNQGISRIGLPVEFYAFSPVALHAVVGGMLWPVKGSRVVSMEYTSYFNAQTSSLNSARKNAFNGSIPALGILGTQSGKTPGRKLGKSLPKHHDVVSLRECFDALRDMDTFKEVYVFALDSAETIEIIEKAVLE